VHKCRAQHSTEKLIIFPFILQTITIEQMMSLKERGHMILMQIQTKQNEKQKNNNPAFVHTVRDYLAGMLDKQWHPTDYRTTQQRTAYN